MAGSLLPRPIRDPTSGKTFVAIPAPPFILSSATSKSPSFKQDPRYIFVQRKDIKVGRAHSRYNDDRIRKPSINRWVVCFESSFCRSHFHCESDLTGQSQSRR